jgi:hypothetical protein
VRYRVPVEFEAVDDDAARSQVETLLLHERDEHNAFLRPVAEELTRESTYWQRVESKP